jgi:hypothetical protein
MSCLCDERLWYIVFIPNIVEMPPFHPMLEFDKSIEWWKFLSWHFLDELVKEFLNMDLQMFQRYQVNAKDIKCPLEWWGKHESLFFTTGVFLAYQILGIVKS